MFGLEIITSAEYEELVSARETLGDRVRHLESKLSNADNALKTVEKKLQDALLESNRHESALLSSREYNSERIEELQKKIALSQQTNETLQQNLDQAYESIADLQKEIAEIKQYFSDSQKEITELKQQLSDSQSWVKQLEEQNQNCVDTIAMFVKQCDETERERNALIVEKGVLRVSFENYQRSVAIAADNFLIEVQKLSPVEVKHE
jgi:chromosome segregation ATPase